MSGPSLITVEEAITGALLLCEDVEESAFLRSRLTRQEVTRQVRAASEVLAQLANSSTNCLPAEIDKSAWLALHGAVQDQDHAQVYRAVQTLLPDTLTWLRVARQSQG